MTKTDEEKRLVKALSAAKDAAWKAQIAYERAYDGGRMPHGFGVLASKEHIYENARKDVAAAQEALDRYNYNYMISMD